MSAQVAPVKVIVASVGKEAGVNARETVTGGIEPALGAVIVVGDAVIETL
jgi:hypothetical protein